MARFNRQGSIDQTAMMAHQLNFRYWVGAHGYIAEIILLTHVLCDEQKSSGSAKFRDPIGLYHH